MSTPRSQHDQHYAPGDIAADIAAALSAMGKDARPLTPAALAGMDQFHTGGMDATRALATLAGISAADRVLDVGGGLGGPARLLAHEIGCRVTVLDLTDAYCRVGETLTERAGLTGRVQFQHGDALDMPFEPGNFDVVWTQHSSMNIADKPRLYAETQRVLRAHGRLALHEVTAGSGEAIHFPVMWADTEAMSFLLPPDTLRERIVTAGFRALTWNDATDWTRTWFQERQRAQQNSAASANGLGLHLLLGSQFGAMARNMALNMQEGRVRVVQGVFERI